MIWTIIIIGLVAILTASWLKPQWFDGLWESTAGNLWVGFVGFALVAVDYLNLDPTWQKLVPPEDLPYYLFAVSLLGLALRYVNKRRG